MGTGVSPLLDDTWHSIRLDDPDGPLLTQHIPGLQLWLQLGFRNSSLDKRGKQIPATVSRLCWGWEGFSAHKGKKLNKETPARSHNSRSVAINSGEELELAPIPAFHGDFQGSSSSLPVQAGVAESLSPQHRSSQGGGTLSSHLGKFHLIFGHKCPIHRDLIQPLLQLSLKLKA